MAQSMAEQKKSPQIKNPDEITLNEFADLVRQMRHNQKRYYKAGRREALQRCGDLEKEVDALLDVFFDRQMTLF